MSHDGRVLELVEPVENVPGHLGEGSALHAFNLTPLTLRPGDEMRRPLDLDGLDLMLGMGRQEELEEPLERLLQPFEGVADGSVVATLLEQEEVAVPAFAVGGRLVEQVWEAVLAEPDGERLG